MVISKRVKVLLIIVTILLFCTIMSSSTEFVIRGNLLLRLHPIQSFTVSIEEVGYDFTNDCHMYKVNGYKPHEWFIPDVFKGISGNIWYLKETRTGIYYVYKGGTTP